MECALDYAGKREAFGAPIAKLQAIQVSNITIAMPQFQFGNIIRVKICVLEILL